MTKMFFSKKHIFYLDQEIVPNAQCHLDAETSKHLAKVLRRQEGDEVIITNGQGQIAQTKIHRLSPQSITVEVVSVEHIPFEGRKLTLAISLLKNPHRWEWMLEKAVELGIYHIVPLICERTETKQSLKVERANKIIISAMLQSGRCWKPTLSEPMPYRSFIQESKAVHRYIAHCVEEEQRLDIRHLPVSGDATDILIGAEGDFTPAEIALSQQYHYSAVSLNTYRLRTETAAIQAICRLL